MADISVEHERDHERNRDRESVWKLQIVGSIAGGLALATVIYFASEVRGTRLLAEKVNQTCITPENWDRIGRPAPQTLRELDSLKSSQRERQDVVDSRFGRLEQEMQNCCRSGKKEYGR